VKRVPVDICVGTSKTKGLKMPNNNLKEKMVSRLNFYWLNCNASAIRDIWGAVLEPSFLSL